jgi:hypothetical protein
VGSIEDGRCVGPVVSFGNVTIFRSSTGRAERYVRASTQRSMKAMCSDVRIPPSGSSRRRAFCNGRIARIGYGMLAMGYGSLF